MSSRGGRSSRGGGQRYRDNSFDRMTGQGNRRQNWSNQQNKEGNEQFYRRDEEGNWNFGSTSYSQNTGGRSKEYGQNYQSGRGGQGGGSRSYEQQSYTGSYSSDSTWSSRQSDNFGKQSAVSDKASLVENIVKAVVSKVMADKDVGHNSLGDVEALAENIGRQALQGVQSANSTSLNQSSYGFGCSGYAGSVGGSQGYAMQYGQTSQTMGFQSQSGMKSFYGDSGFSQLDQGMNRGTRFGGMTDSIRGFHAGGQFQTGTMVGSAGLLRQGIMMNPSMMQSGMSPMEGYVGRNNSDRGYRSDRRERDYRNQRDRSGRRDGRGSRDGSHRERSSSRGRRSRSPSRRDRERGRDHHDSSTHRGQEGRSHSSRRSRSPRSKEPSSSKPSKPRKEPESLNKAKNDAWRDMIAGMESGLPSEGGSCFESQEQSEGGQDEDSENDKKEEKDKAEEEVMDEEDKDIQIAPESLNCYVCDMRNFSSLSSFKKHCKSEDHKYMIALHVKRAKCGFACAKARLNLLNLRIRSYKGKVVEGKAAPLVAEAQKKAIENVENMECCGKKLEDFKAYYEHKVSLLHQKSQLDLAQKRLEEYKNSLPEMTDVPCISEISNYETVEKSWIQLLEKASENAYEPTPDNIIPYDQLEPVGLRYVKKTLFFYCKACNIYSQYPHYFLNVHCTSEKHYNKVYKVSGREEDEKEEEILVQKDDMKGKSEEKKKVSQVKENKSLDEELDEYDNEFQEVDKLLNEDDLFGYEEDKGEEEDKDVLVKEKLVEEDKDVLVKEKLVEASVETGQQVVMATDSGDQLLHTKSGEEEKEEKGTDVASEVEAADDGVQNMGESERNEQEPGALQLQEEKLEEHSEADVSTALEEVSAMEEEPSEAILGDTGEQLTQGENDIEADSSPTPVQKAGGRRLVLKRSRSETGKVPDEKASSPEREMEVTPEKQDPCEATEEVSEEPASKKAKEEEQPEEPEISTPRPSRARRGRGRGRTPAVSGSPTKSEEVEEVEDEAEGVTSIRKSSRRSVTRGRAKSTKN